MFQKSREEWIRLGDKKTKFYHTSIVVRRSRNIVNGLNDNSSNWVFEPNALKDLVSSYFRSLFMDYILKFYVFDTD